VAFVLLWQRAVRKDLFAVGRFGVAALALSTGGALVASPARAEEKLTPPPLSTKGKPVSPPAPSEGAKPRLAGLSLMGGAMAVDLGPLNDRLSRAGYDEKLPSIFPMLGGQGFGLFNRFLIGGSGAGLVPRSTDLPANRRAGALGAWGTVDFGYQLVRINGFLLAPLVSLGGYGMSATLSSRDASTFDATLANPSRGTTLTNKGLLAGASIMAKLIFLGRGADVPGARSGFSLGLRVGGLYGYPYRKWEADGVTAEDGPKFGLRGGYAALSLGVGTW
jgi:hypothetical protein